MGEKRFLKDSLPFGPFLILGALISLFFREFNIFSRFKSFGYLNHKFFKGFTLIELSVVIAMVGVMISLLLIFINPFKQIQKVRDAQRQADLSQIRQALDTYYNDKNCYPDSLSFGSSWETGSTVYMKKVPQDPDCASGGSCYQYLKDTASCPQWNVLFSKAIGNDNATACALKSYPTSCVPSNYFESGYNSCLISGTVNCSSIVAMSIPISGGSETVPTTITTTTTTSAATTITTSAATTITTTTVPDLTDYYVATNGNDSNPGTQVLPFATISKANSVVTPGDTVHVLPGTYYQNVLTTTNGTASQRIVYKSETKWGAKIVGSGISPLFATWENTGNAYIDVNGFDISGGGRFGILNYNGANNINVLANHVHDIAVGFCTSIGGDGIGSTENGGTHDNNYIGNLINNVSVSTKPCSYVHGFYVQGLREKVINNLVINNAGLGIACTHACNEPTIANNTIINNGYGIRVGWSSVNPGKTNNAIISNNIVMNNINYAIYEYITGMGINNQLLNNLLYGNNPNTCSAGDCLNTISSNPLFINYQPDGSGNYRLQSTSPAIDKGTSIGAPTTDYDGALRPNGSGYDIGAFEYR